MTVVLLVLAASVVMPHTEAGPQRSESLLPEASGFQTLATDPAEDVRGTSVADLPGAVPADFDAPVDLLELQLGEDERDLSFRLFFRGHPAEAATAGEVTNTPITCLVDFTLGADPNTRYSLRITTEAMMDGGPYVYEGERWRSDRGASSGDSDFEFLDVALIDGRYVEAAVPKAFLRGALGGPAGPGDVVYLDSVYCLRSIAPPFVVLSDVLDGPIESFAVTRGAKNVALRAAWHGPAGLGETVHIAHAEPRPMALTIINTGPDLIKTKIRARVLTGLNEVALGWNVSHTPTIDVPPYATVRPVFMVHPPAKSADATLSVQLDEHPSRNVLQTAAGLEAVRPLERDDPRLFLSETFVGTASFVLDKAPTPTRALDEGFTHGTTPETQVAWGDMRHGITRDFVPTGGPWVFETASLEGVPHQGTYRFEVRVHQGKADGPEDGRLVAATETSVTVSPLSGPFRVEIPTNDTPWRLAPGDNVLLVISPVEATGSDELIDWVKSRSVLQVPVQVATRSGTDDPVHNALPSFVADITDGGSVIVRPGGTVAFGGWLANVGGVAGTMTGTVDAPSDWRVRSTFDAPVGLAAGETSPVCIVIEAPASAADRADLTVRFSSDGGIRVDETIPVTIDGDADDDPRCPLYTPDPLVLSKDVPVTLVGVLGFVLVGAGLAARRRR